MQRLISVYLPAARSLAEIARAALLETQSAAVTKVADMRAQVEELWEAAGEMRSKPAELMKRVESAIEAMRRRDTIGFPTVR